MENALINIVSTGPLVVEVPAEAGLHVEGNDYWAWWPDSKGRLQGGAVLSENGGREHIADALRRAYAPDDVRWSRTMPEPFWEVVS